MKNKCYMGIDPGDKGFLALQYNGVFEHYSIKDNDLYQISEIMGDIRKRFPNLICVIEDVHALFSVSAKSTFNFGFNKGYLMGLLAANHIPYVLVQPKTWQKEMWGNSDIVVTYQKVTIKDKETTRKKVDTKQTSFNAAKRLFPDIDFRKTKRCTNWDDNKVDSTLMSEYARRKNL